MSHSEDTPYKVSGPLILSGGLTSTSQAKCYHALLILGQLAGWKPDSRGEYRVGLGELHKLTNGTHRRWEDYLQTLRGIRDTVRLDWGHLSRTVKGFNRAGDTPILYDVRAELDMAGEFQELVFVLPATLIEDVIKPHWYGQANPEVLFRMKSNYAFHAYLFASLTVVEKDSSKAEFFSHAYTLAEWREILGVEEGKNRLPSQLRKNVFKRTEEQIRKVTAGTDQPLEVEWIQTPRKLYQMRVHRLPRKQIATPKPPSQKDQFKAAQEVQRQKDRERHQSDILSLTRAVDGHPRASEIRELIGGGPVTWFALLPALDRLGIAENEFSN